MTAKHASKEVKRYIAMAEHQGWTVDTTSNGHHQFKPPTGGEMVVTGPSPTYRGLKNLRADLRRAGLLISQEDWIRAGKMRTVVTDDAVAKFRETYERTCVDARTKEMVDTRLLTDDEIRSVIEFDNRGSGPPTTDDFKCPWCNKQYPTYIAAYTHRRKCDKQPDGYTDYESLEDEVKRDLMDPPARERLTCAICPYWCWVSQPHLLDTHMRVEHGLGICPFCNETAKIANGGLERHMDVCMNKPQEAREGYIESSPQPWIATLPATPEPIVVLDSNIEEQGEPIVHHDETVYAEVTEDLRAEVEDVDEEIDLEDLEIVDVAPPATEPVGRPRVHSESTDDELWTHLELILDGPVMVTRESLAAINAWMDATRTLLRLREQG